MRCGLSKSRTARRFSCPTLTLVSMSTVVVCWWTGSAGRGGLLPTPRRRWGSRVSAPTAGSRGSTPRVRPGWSTGPHAPGRARTARRGGGGRDPDRTDRASSRPGLARTRAGRAGSHRQPGAAPPPGAAPAGAGSADRGGDPLVQGHRGPLRAGPARRAGPRRRQEDRQDPRRRRLACLGPGRDRDHRHKKVRIGYDYVHSMVDDHSRLAYSEILPDEKGAPAPRSSPAPRPTSPPTASR